MKILISTIIYLMIHSILQAQKPESLARVYYVRRVMEVASGVQLNKDSTFEFFFVYGALDRIGSGTWTVQNNQIILNTRKRPASDFLLVESKKVPGNKITVQMGDNNPMILQHVSCVLTSNGSTLEANTDQEGIASFPLKDADKLSLIFELCPDRYSDFPITKTHNYYKFTLQPWVTEIFLENFRLNIDKEGNLEGKHPIMDKERYTYERSTEQ